MPRAGARGNDWPTDQFPTHASHAQGHAGARPARALGWVAARPGAVPVRMLCKKKCSPTGIERGAKPCARTFARGATGKWKGNRARIPAPAPRQREADRRKLAHGKCGNRGFAARRQAGVRALAVTAHCALSSPGWEPRWRTARIISVVLCPDVDTLDKGPGRSRARERRCATRVRPSKDHTVQAVSAQGSATDDALSPRLPGCHF